MDPVSARVWKLRGEEPGGALLVQLARELRISDLAARILAVRGISETETGREFLSSRLSSLPDPARLGGMAEAVARLARAIRGGELIAIHGDYDVDGITGTTLLVESLRAMGGQAIYHIPLRLKDGYGLSGEAIRTLHARGASVLVSVDCGISAVAEADLARELGLDLIITDHHQPGDQLPRALALIDPHLPGDAFPDKHLAGVGVAFFLLLGLRRHLREAGGFDELPEPDLRLSLDLVALGTIADIVPLTGVNRILTTAGLTLLRQGRRPGVEALKEVAGVREVSCGTVGFQLAPRLNAAGRLEDAALGVELLLSETREHGLEIARRLDACNRERQAIEQETLQQALARIGELADSGRRSIVLADARWHPGVIGIVASRLVEKFYRPTVLIALENGGGKGSARSIKGFHLYRALARCAGSLKGYGGHEYAAGLTVESTAVQDFCDQFERVAQETLTPEQLQPSLTYDAEIALEEFDLEAVADLERLAPFGPGNPEPVFLVQGARMQQPRRVGQDHLQFTLRQGGYSAACIGFGMAGRWRDTEGEIDVLCSAQINRWRGRQSVQLRIRDLRPAR